MGDGLSLHRRALLQRAFLLAGVAVLPGGVEALAAPAKASGHLLDPTRYALLTAVADTMVPKTDTVGAVDVGVPAQVDALLRNWAAPDHRDQIIAALDAVDASARQGAGKAFAALTPQERHDVLTAHDAAALKPPAPGQAPARDPLAKAPAVADPKTGKLKQEAAQSFSMGPPVADPGYAKLKELVVVLYYFSEAALTQELPYEHAPGEWRPSVPVTPDTRPSGGAAFM